MSYPQGQLLSAPISNGYQGADFGTHISYLGTGGYREVATTAERNAIAIKPGEIEYDGLGSGLRRVLMVVAVVEERQLYILDIPDYASLSDADKLTALADNGNWVVFANFLSNSFNFARLDQPNLFKAANTFSYFDYRITVDGQNLAFQYTDPTSGDSYGGHFYVDATTHKLRFDSDKGVVLPPPVDGEDAANKAYVDQAIAASVPTIDETNLVHKTGAETIAGVKTFTNQPLYKDGLLVQGPNGSNSFYQIASFQATVYQNGRALLSSVNGFQLLDNNVPIATLELMGGKFVLTSSVVEVSQDPTTALGIATKQYVDAKVAASTPTVTPIQVKQFSFTIQDDGVDNSYQNNALNATIFDVQLREYQYNSVRPIPPSTYSYDAATHTFTIKADANVAASDVVYGRYIEGSGVSGSGGGGGTGSSNVLPKPRLEFAKITPSGTSPAPVAGMLQHVLRVYFTEDVSALATLNPEIWLFRYKKGRKKFGAGQADVITKGAWKHAPDADQNRHTQSNFFHGEANGRKTEWFGTAVSTAMAQNKKVEVALASADWFKPTNNPSEKPAPIAKSTEGTQQRFRVALVVDDPSTASGKRMSELSDVFLLKATKEKDPSATPDYFYYFTLRPDITAWRS